MKTTNTLPINTKKGVLVSFAPVAKFISTIITFNFSYWLSMAILGLVVISFFIPVVWYSINYGLTNV